MTTSRRSFLSLGLAAGCACIGAAPGSASAAEGKFICPPCGCAMDGRDFDGPGACPACGMTLIPKSEPPFEPGALPAARGVFTTRGGRGREHQRIEVHYVKPASFTPRSQILIVLPGAGRSAGEYCDAWRSTAEARGVLVAALGYPEEHYDFAAYHLGGVVKNFRILNAPPEADGRSPAILRLRDEDIVFEPNPDPASWLFHDFDRIFGLLVRATGSRRGGYDLFGHSAGGQILHRLVLFHPRSKAERIVAANAGFYTLPDFEIPQPFGLKGAGLTPAKLKPAFSQRLMLLVGGNDDGDHAGGIQLRTPLADRQGVGRLSRGRHFFAAGKARAAALETPFNWTFQVVPGVGHDFRAMSRAADALLYA